MHECWRRSLLVLTVIGCCLALIAAIGFSILAVSITDKTDNMRSLLGIGILLSFFLALVLLVIIVYLVHHLPVVIVDESTNEDCPLIPVK